MKPAPIERLASLGITTMIHIAAGVALFMVLAPGGKGSRGMHADRSGALVVELIPLARENRHASARADPWLQKAHSDVASAPRELAPLPSGTGRRASTAEPADAAKPVLHSEPPGSAASDMTGSAAILYRDILLAHIARYRRYPSEARDARIEGVVEIRFVLDRKGHVQDAWVASSSGRTSLDQEALAAIRRAVPMPGIPSELPDRIDITLPVDFEIG
ncbi:energy transducer TonB [Sphingomonas psychrotolerans]|uniref:TonB C-terminal domain-containing protein n=1 Tax=Sphingomonas psychrotolerans TaxID=1327635 RepID=A0A2K8MJZ3_9SPHN|nr:energy transducer TonB [Sphingomonas psychrotolerans]ATY34198.1 hypothetical protein CVN68_21405 [Sphingomonas psychrotolerans]